MSGRVSRNARRGVTSTPPLAGSGSSTGADVRGWGVLLRAAATEVRAADMLYVAAAALMNPTNKAARTYNQGVIDMVAALLSMPDADPELIEHVLRNLPTESESR